jgi:hypothetical protein
MGQKTEKDQSICIGSFRNISKDDWIKMCGLIGNTVSDVTVNSDANVNVVLSDVEKLRALRLAYYDSKKDTPT